MNMKCKLLAAAAAGALIVGSTSYADVMADVHPYIGAELSYNMPKYNSINDTDGDAIDIKRNKLGYGVDVGARICDYFGLEVGYNQVLKAKDKDDSDKSGKINNMYLDAMGYFAANPEIDIIGAVGIGRLKQKVSGFSVANDETKAKTSYRLGVGAQYKFDENIAARLMVRHQKGNKDFLKNMNSVALGVTYTF